MTSRTLLILAACIGLLLSASTAVRGQGAPCSQCGPGDHWVDQCSLLVPGQDQIANTGALAGIDLDLDCVADMNLVLGPCPVPDDLLVVDKDPGPLDDSMHFPGISDTNTALHPGPGFDVVDTELRSMCLTDGTFTLRAGNPHHPPFLPQCAIGCVPPPSVPCQPSLGSVVERGPDQNPPLPDGPPQPELADSFFDVFFSVELPGGSCVYNQTPARVDAVVDCLPPRAPYIHQTGCIPLFTDTVGGAHVANLVSAQHNVNPISLSHFKCYKARETSTPRFARRNVTLVDQFGPTTPEVQSPLRLCNPVDKNGEGIPDPTAHLMCYRIKEARGPRRDVTVRNQLGEQALTVIKPETLCVPAAKDAVPLSSAAGAFLNHFKCYRVKGQGFQQQTVSLADQFETRTTTLVKPRLLCTPVDKNGEGIPDPVNHLTCYRAMPGPPKFTPREVTVTDQFAQQDLRSLRGVCRQVDILCVPSFKFVASPGGAFLDTSD
jgi:hypothetical protein